MDGLLTEVVISTNGSAATAAVAIGGTSVPVENLTEFADDGGKVDIAGVVYDYTGVDITTVDPDGIGGAILLATPLTVAVAEFDPVLLLVGGEPAVDYFAEVDLVDDEDGEPVLVPLETREERLAWPVRVYDPPLPVTLAPDLSRIVRAPGVTPQMDGALIDPTSTIPGGQAFSLDAPTATDDYPEDYGWWQVDAAGKVLGFWRLVGGVWTAQTIVTVEALKANNAIIDALTGTTITGTTVQTRGTPDRGIKLGEVKGSTNYDEAFIVFKENGDYFIKAVPEEGMAVIAGEMKTTTQTTTDGSSLGGITEITRHPDGTAGAVRLTGYTTAPKSAPTVTGGYDTLQFTNDGLWGSRHGWTTDGTNWFTTRSVSGGYQVEKWSAAGSLVATSVPVGGSGTEATGIAVDAAGGNLYVLALIAGIGAHWTLYRWNPSTLALTNADEWVDDDGTAAAAVGWDTAASEILIAQSRPTNADKVRIKRYTMSGSTLTASATAAVDTAFGYGNDLSGVLYGSFDLGANRYIFTNQAGGQFRVVNTSGAAVDAEDWQAGTSGKVGFAYTGGAFVSMDATGLMRTYTGQDKATLIGDAALTKWVSNDLSTATLHTDQSPRAKITIKKRTKLNVTTSAINTGGANAPDRVRIFVGQGAADPGRTAMWKQTDPAVGVTSASYSSLATSGTNPVTPNGFIGAGGTVQRLELADATAFIDGIGNGSVGAGTFRDSVRSAVMGDYAAGAWTAYTPTFTATTTNPTLGSFNRAGRYTQRGKTVTFVAVITATAATGLGVGTYAFGLPVTARSSTGAFIGDEVIVTANQNAPNHSYIGRGGGSVTEVTLFLTSTDAVATNTSTGMASGTTIRITGTYEAA